MSRATEQRSGPPTIPLFPSWTSCWRQTPARTTACSSTRTVMVRLASLRLSTGRWLTSFSPASTRPATFELFSFAWEFFDDELQTIHSTTGHVVGRVDVVAGVPRDGFRQVAGQAAEVRRSDRLFGLRSTPLRSERRGVAPRRVRELWGGRVRPRGGAGFSDWSRCGCLPGGEWRS